MAALLSSRTKGARVLRVEERTGRGVVESSADEGKPGGKRRTEVHFANGPHLRPFLPERFPFKHSMDDKIT